MAGPALQPPLDWVDRASNQEGSKVIAWRLYRGLGQCCLDAFNLWTTRGHSLLRVAAVSSQLFSVSTLASLAWLRQLPVSPPRPSHDDREDIRISNRLRVADFDEVITFRLRLKSKNYCILDRLQQVLKVVTRSSEPLISFKCYHLVLMSIIISSLSAP